MKCKSYVPNYTIGTHNKHVNIIRMNDWRKKTTYMVDSYDKETNLILAQKYLILHVLGTVMCYEK